MTDLPHERGGDRQQANRTCLGSALGWDDGGYRNMIETAQQTRIVSPQLLALGREPLPQRIQIDSREYELEQVYKHDFFAATARYANHDARIVLKIGRQAPFLGIPLGWIGRLHAIHETALYGALQDLPVVPAFIGRYGAHGFAHEYIEGHHMTKGEHVPDDFFDRLREALQEIHRRDMAYVDLEKCENVLVGDDGRPYLIDFQISWRWPWRLGADLFPLRWLRQRFQNADHYHLIKLQRRTRPDQLSEETLRNSYRKPGVIRVLSKLTRPITLLRRKILDWVAPRTGPGERGRIA